jgi:hypothetical protein
MWIELPQISPAARTSACSVCGSNVPSVPALTSGVHVEFEGNIEVCKRCIIEAAVIYGMHTDEEYTTLADAHMELQVWSEHAYAELQAFQAVRDSLAASDRVGG